MSDDVERSAARLKRVFVEELPILQKVKGILSPEKECDALVAGMTECTLAIGFDRSVLANAYRRAAEALEVGAGN